MSFYEIFFYGEGDKILPVKKDNFLENCLIFMKTTFLIAFFKGPVGNLWIKVYFVIVKHVISVSFIILSIQLLFRYFDILRYYDNSSVSMFRNLRYFVSFVSVIVRVSNHRNNEITKRKYFRGNSIHFT